MNISLNWLKDFVDIDVDRDTLANLFNIHSAEVESVRKLVDTSMLTVGKVIKKEAHENADKLSVCQVQLKNETAQIICGAPNVQEGQMVIVALPGAVLPRTLKIKTSTIRGVTSNGMICSLPELGIDKKYADASGIHVIKEDCNIGDNPLEVMALDDDVIEIDILPNRPDLLSMMGVAYDVSAILNTPINLKDITVKEVDKTNNVTIKLSTEYCMSYYARVLENAQIKPSPRWMQSRLIAADIRPINNVVDITNYVMLETGQPLHAFDYDLLESDVIEVRLAKKNEKLRTLDNATRTLNKEDIVITNGTKAVALGGVMGGYDTEISSSTKRILLESAVFDPQHVRKTSSRLNLRSEASMRFERKVDPKRTRYALELASYYFNKYANADVLKDIQKVDHTTHDDKIINVSTTLINDNLGTELSQSEITNILHRLHFETKQDKDSITVYVPSRRQDIEGYQDIIEEVVRILGYDRLPVTLPSTVNHGRLTDYQVFKRKLKETLTGLGLSETITYSLMQEDRVHEFVIGDKRPVHLQLPMSKDKSVLQLSQLSNMLDVVGYNNARKQENIHIFELGKSYTKNGETELISGVLKGELSHISWQNTVETVDFFTAKGLLESLFEALNLSHLTFVPTDAYDTCHPGQTALIRDIKGTVGFLGKLHPEYAKTHDLDAIYVFECDVRKLYDYRRVLRSANPINKYPEVSRDLSIVVAKDVTASTLKSQIVKDGKRMLKDVVITDLYQGEPLDDNQKSITVRLNFTDETKTLKTEDVDARMDKIVNGLRQSNKAIIRDY
ncbi:MAG: phenylalanine--tRNA ligase subunit beta [Candidatus Izimaplasma sp.]|nr:phenylalanine--tRNA ligase subunit beta [Candidatus Izimaplasma bacterium]